MRSLQRLGALALLALAVACGPAATSPAAPGAGGTSVSYKGFQVDPKSIEITAGQVVTWTNSDSSAHTVTAGTPGSKSGAFDQKLAANGSTKVTFDRAGTFDYFCELHTTMVGRIVVK